MLCRFDTNCVNMIGMQMLAPRKLFCAQGFPDGYVIDPVYNGKPLTKTAGQGGEGTQCSVLIVKAVDQPVGVMAACVTQGNMT